ncbi:MAG: hypothetical protein RIR86_1362 [Acidobacteriota bacterium]|jgi:hypothetical protein
MKRNMIMAAIALTLLAVPSTMAQNKVEKGFKSLFDGKTFNGWKMANENQDSWSIKEGAIVANGPRAHIYYVGDEKQFVDFELKIDAMTGPVSNGGIYIHTQYQEIGWPKNGYEIQVNQTHGDWKKSGSIYDVANVKDVVVKDNEWYTYTITVKGKRITVKLNDTVVNDWTEEPDRQPGKDFTRILSKGTIALQAHDPKSVVRYKNIRIKRL